MLNRISIITVCYNSINTIRDTIDSVLKQTYKNIEYIIIDGGSTDGTVELVTSYGKNVNKFISEPDRGMYNALNKGLKIASGDIVGILNSDDFFTNDRIIELVADEFRQKELEAVYGDVQFVRPSDKTKVVRYYSSKQFNPGKFKFGFMPAHPSFYVRLELFEKFGFYKENYKIGSDFDLLVRFLYIKKVKYKYLQMSFVNMRTGGLSNKNLGSILTLNKEIARACKENGIKTNLFLIYSKYLIKAFEFMGNRSHNRK